MRERYIRGYERLEKCSAKFLSLFPVLPSDVFSEQLSPNCCSDHSVKWQGADLEQTSIPWEGGGGGGVICYSAVMVVHLLTYLI